MNAMISHQENLETFTSEVEVAPEVEVALPEIIIIIFENQVILVLYAVG